MNKTFQNLVFATAIALAAGALGALTTTVVILFRSLLYETPWLPAVYWAGAGIIMVACAAGVGYLCSMMPSSGEARSVWDLERYINELVSLVGTPMPLKETGLERKKTYVIQLGNEINAKFGFKGMQVAAEAVRASKGPSAVSDINRIWNGIGQWRK